MRKYTWAEFNFEFLASGSDRLVTKFTFRENCAFNTYYPFMNRAVIVIFFLEKICKLASVAKATRWLVARFKIVDFIVERKRVYGVNKCTDRRDCLLDLFVPQRESQD